MRTSTAADLRSANLSRALRAVHEADSPLTRAELGRRLGCVRATVGALVSDLDALGLVRERAAETTGRRGRPSARLGPAEEGPVVVALEITTHAARTATIPIGGAPCDVTTEALPGREVDAVLDTARSLLARRLDTLTGRHAGVGVAMHGLVDRRTRRVLSAPGLGWADLDLDVLDRLGLPADRRARIDNVANSSALAESVRGRARGVGTVLYLHAAVGLGGALLADGRLVAGRRGLAGEYGHLPFGTGDRLCRCGNRGCWETSVDQVALAEAAGRDATPWTAETVAGEVLADGSRSARDAVARTASALGRGIGALVTAVDPDLVLLAGHAATLFAAASERVHEAAAAACLPLHRSDLPPIETSTLGDDAGLVGAAESVYAVLLDDPATLMTPWTAA
ncbi:ROK family transcriptional regulator [Cryptosporangium aurantiacum]|uniref:ROK family transcriptional regulator n=1 Tax=Cryptosporangium aurantiacum TaxID=134849 RepID=UPI0009356545|nr:ROK family transcriptional regulator [Cryptosporangium aurantiacum]